MTRKKSMPPELVSTISRLGEHIRIARKRRLITMDEMASRMYVTRKTLSRLENGEPGVSLGVFALALWVLGFDKELLNIAAPEQDRVGVFLERRRLPERVRRAAKADEPDF
ncbi:MAG: transcriptional regulator [Deltaproteobacteria bacterium]|nr:MAG: transcriptional regulator [Deltaproteobacteria bacterium]